MSPMNGGTNDRGQQLDLDLEQVRFMLKQQGYVIPEEELVEVTASLNALIDGLTHMEQYGELQNEPWPVLVGYEGGNPGQAEIELTYNWGTESYDMGTAYGHIALGVPDAYAACEKIKAHSAWRDIPVVMVTALNEVGDVERAVDSGADDFLTKPVNRLELVTRVRSLLRVRILKKKLDRTLAEMKRMKEPG